MDAYDLYNKLGPHSPSNGPVVVVSLDTGQQYELLDTVSEDGQFTLYFGDAPAEPADSRREVVAKALQQRDDSDNRGWDAVSQQGKGFYLADADAVLSALDAHAQQQNDGQRDGDGDCYTCRVGPGHDIDCPDRSLSTPARYRDSDGDVWEENSDGTYDLTLFSNGSRPFPDTREEYSGYSFSKLSGRLGPLTRI